MTAGKPSLLKAPPFQRFNSSTVQRGGSPVDRLARARLQKWVHCAMRTLLSRAIQVDPSFHIGLGLIVILAVAEIFFAASYYVGRARAARISAQAVAANVARPAAPSVSAQTPAPAPAQPAVSPATVPALSPSLVDQLLREGIELRGRGNTTNALARLQEALDSEPNNTVVLEELANQRLKLGVPTPGTADSGVANSSADAAEHKDIGGNLEGAVMGITQVKTTETPDPDAEKNLAMQIGVKKQPGAVIDHNKVKILVRFYDTVGDKDIKLTDADVNYEWLTPKHDWTETNPEVLSVKYVRAKTGGVSSDSSLAEAAATVRPGQKARGAKGSAADSGRRKYLGYIIQVYYDDDLQAIQAEPSRLLQLFPPSTSTSAR